MIAKTTDTVDIAALIEAAEARATCKMGMAKARKSFLVRLAPEDAAALGVFGDHLSLCVEARPGTVDLVYAAADGTVDGGYREISSEPSEPELQALAVSHARRNPIGAALELLRIDLEHRATFAEVYAEEAGLYDGERLCAAHERLPDQFTFRDPSGGRTRYTYTGPHSYDVHEWDDRAEAWVGTGSAHIDDDTTVIEFVESRED
ncbi:hypothetical protein [Methylorubrum extorquens]|uniref:Uncharacterized protein n=1 Tax=Methylorubrum extorquens TaxID=408 RepID=A0AAX3WB25_METEX|nr:hypothetical protein [Methylorubrum extorquens]WHQ68647.1 hypothetical protein KEC54_20090 [Methylorubrum extorquens]